MTSLPSANQTKRSERVALLVLVAMSLFLFLLGAIDPPGLRVPSWVAYLLAFVLLMGAAALASRMAGHARANSLFAMLLLLGLATVGERIASGRGDSRACVRRAGTGESYRRAVAASPTTCRVVFGGGATICLAMACVAASMAWRGGRTVSEGRPR